MASTGGLQVPKNLANNGSGWLNGVASISLENSTGAVSLKDVRRTIE